MPRLERVERKSDQTDAPLGALPTENARRARPGAVVAARVARMGHSAPRVVRGLDGVVPLNPGFFAAQAIRAATIAGKKARAKGRAKVRDR